MTKMQNKPIVLAELPQIPPALIVYEVRAATLEERSGAIQILQQNLKLNEPLSVRIEESMRFISQTGEVEFYRPSGALWAHDYASTLEYKDERRPWESRTIETEEGPQVVLDEAVQQHVMTSAEGLFREAKLRSEHAFFADVILDQVHMHSPNGEKAVFAGEATVRFFYRLQELPVAGPGAKTYAFFHEPDRIGGAYHAWRDVVAEHEVETVSAEAALDLWFGQDQQIITNLKRDQVVEITSVELAYYALPPSKFQDFLFPVFRVIGFIYDGKERNNGIQFARFCHALPPQVYARANLFADTLMIRP